MRQICTKNDYSGEYWLGLGQSIVMADRHV